MTRGDWIGLIGPGGAIGILVALDLIFRRWYKMRRASDTTVIDQWREIAETHRIELAKARRQQAQMAALIEYWRSRAASSEFVIINNGLNLPPFPPEPKIRL